MVFVSATLIATSDARKDGGAEHCMDKMRGLIPEACKILNSVYKIRRESRQVHVMDNEILQDDDGLEFEFFENESEYDLFFVFVFALNVYARPLKVQ